MNISVDYNNDKVTDVANTFDTLSTYVIKS